MSALRHELVAGEDPTVVFLHEGAGSGLLWDGLRDSIRGGRRAVLYDRRGFGGSPRDASFGPDHFEQAVDDLVELVRETGAGPVDLVGHSDGGSVALLAAIRHPAAIRSVCAVSTHVYADAQTIAALRSLGPVHEWDGRTRDHYARQHGDDWPEVVASWVEMWTTGSLAAWDIHADAIVASVTAAQLSWHDSRSHRPHLTDRERFRSDLQSFWATVSTAR